MLVKLDHFLNFRGEHKKIFELPPPSLGLYEYIHHCPGIHPLLQQSRAGFHTCIWGVATPNPSSSHSTPKIFVFFLPFELAENPPLEGQDMPRHVYLHNGSKGTQNTNSSEVLGDYEGNYIFIIPQEVPVLFAHFPKQHTLVKEKPFKLPVVFQAILQPSLVRNDVKAPPPSQKVMTCFDLQI